MTNTLSGTCYSCSYKVEINVTEKEMERFAKNEPIQNILPDVSPNDREVLISGVCGRCFVKMTVFEDDIDSQKETSQSTERTLLEDRALKFKKNSALNFFNVLHLQKYLEGHKGYIAGGCFKNIFKKEPVKDIDLFFENEADFKEAKKLFDKKEKHFLIYENSNAIGYYDEEREVAIDLVQSQFSSPEQMIEGFDFTITKFALHNEEVENEDGDVSYELKVVYHENFFEHLTMNRLVIDGDTVDFPLNTFDRILRYSKYGYVPCTETKVKIIRMINEMRLPESDEKLFSGFYVGID